MIGRELDGYWKTVVNTIRDGVMIINPGGTIVSVNTAVERITGYGREELIGTHCSILDTEPDHNSRRFSESPAGSSNSPNDSDQHQCLVKRKDGSLVHTLKTTAVLDDGAGNALGRVYTITDLTEIVEKENQLAAYRKQLDAEHDFHGIIGDSPVMRKVFDIIEKCRPIRGTGHHLWRKRYR